MILKYILFGKKNKLKQTFMIELYKINFKYDMFYQTYINKKNHYTTRY